MTLSDLDLLRDYRQTRSDDAFAELVRRHLNLVYSAALRQVRSPQLAEEVAQSTFTDLARNAHRLAPDTILTAWLYQVSQRTAIDVVRRESRRQLRDQIATEMNRMNATDADWKHIEPLLDEAMLALDDTDRTALLLRYFENQSLREVGAALGTSDDAAQKRVTRAVEHLREFFAKRGVTVGAAGIVVVISTNAVQAAPAGLAVTIATAAGVVGTTLVATTTATVVKTFAMTTLQKAVITAVAVAAIGAGIYQANQVSKLRRQIEVLDQQLSSTGSSNDASQSALQEKVDLLASQNASLTNALAAANADKAQLKTEREQARHSAAMFKELAEHNSGDDSATNQFPTSRHAMVGMGKLIRRSVELTNYDDSNLSSEEKSAHTTLKMNFMLDVINTMKTIKQAEMAAPPNTKEDSADSGACLLYGALDLNEQQFGQVYSLLQKYDQQAELLSPAGQNPTPEVTASVDKLSDQVKTQIETVLTADQAKMFEQMSANLHLMHGAGTSGGFNINFNDK